ncbi:hypothetical protein SAMN05421757_107241 [Tropicimonas sediminicola]|uniref:Uncharacterized protein n=2 Tax=Tropicimonas sediminicola TaxID=1031541 RepID=A0A239KNG3_9RHOB|nr:hypothetical protein SAMN05421757_107241 [Tropicimonas sediminicola]
MWVFRTIVLVPRPDLAGIAPCLALLAVFAAFNGRDVLAFGQPVAPLNIAVATALFVFLMRNILLLRREVLPVDVPVGWGVGGILAPLVLFAPSPEVVQQGVSILLLGLALGILVVLRFAPDLTDRIPSIWSGSGQGASDALLIVAVSLALRAVGAWLLVVAGEPALWVLFVSVGGIAADFLTNWIILLYLFVNRHNERQP